MFKGLFGGKKPEAPKPAGPKHVNPFCDLTRKWMVEPVYLGCGHQFEFNVLVANFLNKSFANNEVNQGKEKITLPDPQIDAKVQTMMKRYQGYLTCPCCSFVIGGGVTYQKDRETLEVLARGAAPFFVLVKSNADDAYHVLAFIRDPSLDTYQELKARLVKAPAENTVVDPRFSAPRKYLRPGEPLDAGPYMNAEGTGWAKDKKDKVSERHWEFGSPKEYGSPTVTPFSVSQNTYKCLQNVAQGVSLESMFVIDQSAPMYPASASSSSPASVGGRMSPPSAAPVYAAPFAAAAAYASSPADEVKAVALGHPMQLLEPKDEYYCNLTNLLMIHPVKLACEHHYELSVLQVFCKFVSEYCPICQNPKFVGQKTDPLFGMLKLPSPEQLAHHVDRVLEQDILRYMAARPEAEWKIYLGDFNLPGGSGQHAAFRLALTEADYQEALRLYPDIAHFEKAILSNDSSAVSNTRLYPLVRANVSPASVRSSGSAAAASPAPALAVPERIAPNPFVQMKLMLSSQSQPYFTDLGQGWDQAGWVPLWALLPRDKYYSPITNRLMIEPVQLKYCGHIFEKKLAFIYLDCYAPRCPYANERFRGTPLFCDTGEFLSFFPTEQQIEDVLIPRPELAWEIERYVAAVLGASTKDVDFSQFFLEACPSAGAFNLIHQLQHALEQNASSGKPFSLKELKSTIGKEADAIKSLSQRQQLAEAQMSYGRVLIHFRKWLDQVKEHEGLKNGMLKISDVIAAIRSECLPLVKFPVKKDRFNQSTVKRLMQQQAPKSEVGDAAQSFRLDSGKKTWVEFIAENIEIVS